MTRYVVDLAELDRTQVALAGGKGAHLGELTRIDGVEVPPGFCVTTAAFRRVIAGAPAIGPLLDRLSRLEPGDREAVGTLSAELRRAVRAVEIPADLAAEITGRLGGAGNGGGATPGAYAVRSSATAEDLPTASFAGQHDTYLNVIGADAVLEHVRRGWASLFTERAVTYRRRQGVDHRAVGMAVVVQRMVLPRAAGILFTADPVTSNRKVASVDASFGLGEALVSGLVNPDVYKVRDGEIVERTVAAKRLAVEALPSGGTEHRRIAPERQDRPALTDAEILRLVGLGRRIEAHFGRPQDIEWCLDPTGEILIVQSRPITTLFPVPAAGDDGNHVYVSVGHQQMMTEAMTPLGLSFWQMTTPRPMAEAGGRLFVDVTLALAAPASRENLIGALGKSDPLLGDALRTVVARAGFLPTVAEDAPVWTAPGTALDPVETDPAVVTGLIERMRESFAAAERDIRTHSGPALLDFIRADLQELRRVMVDPRSMQAIMAGMEATWWLNDTLREWLGERNAADTLTQSVPHNITSEMGLALLDVADVVRAHPEVVKFLETVDSDDFLDKLPGTEARAAITGFLDTYGMRCVGEIDITRPRWRERPSALVPLILGNVRNFEPGAHARLFERGRREAEQKEREILERLRAEPDGERKAAETKKMIDRVRTFAGYREYPKYHMISRYFLYKQALLREHGEDIFFLRFDELYDGRVDRELVRERREAFASYRGLTPPRVLTSEGEAVTGSYHRDDLPAGALVGLPVSVGTVEGRARVVPDIADADLSPGDILVTAFTDPSWTPVFVTIAGLVTEVGGLMTHGAVIAREYGLPAVVGVEQATTRIRDGQRIRVHGTDGYVEVLPDPPAAGS